MADLKIVVCGGGYAGMAAIRGLTTVPGAEVHLVDPGWGHELIPELPDALKTGGDVDHHVLPFTEVLKHWPVRWHRTQLVRLDLERRQAVTGDGYEMPYDWMVLSLGSVTSWPKLPGLREHAVAFRTADDARRLQEKLSRKARQQVIVIGGGLTGTELAGVIGEQHQVTLMEMAPRILPGLGPGLARYAARALEQSGVKVLLKQKLTRITAREVERTTGEVVPYDTLVWAGGIRPPEAIAASGLPVDDHGYPVVDAWGRVVPRVFVAGDLWIVREGKTLFPQTAQLATMTGAYVAETIDSRIRGGSPGPKFHARNRGVLISLDANRGVGWVVNQGIPVRGYSAGLLKDLAFSQYRLKLAKEFGRPWPWKKTHP